MSDSDSTSNSLEPKTQSPNYDASVKQNRDRARQTNTAVKPESERASKTETANITVPEEARQSKADAVPFIQEFIPPPKRTVHTKTDYRVNGTRYEPYNDATKYKFNAGSTDKKADGTFLRNCEMSKVMVEGLDIADVKGQAGISICNIHYTNWRQEGSGSGFRIGPPHMKLVLTANHVLQDILSPQQSVFNTSLKSNVLRLSSVWCVFGHTHDDYQPTQEDKFFFEPVVLFHDYETDTAILQLKDNSFGKEMPPPFKHYNMPVPNEPFHLIGHPDGGKKLSCRCTGIIDSTSEITETHIANVRHWCSSVGLVCEPSEHDMLDNPKRLLFEVADTFTKGASGCPGLVLNPLESTFTVVTVLLRGFPDSYYSKNLIPPIKFPDNISIEQGANMKEMFNNLKKQSPELYKAMFEQEYAFSK